MEQTMIQLVTANGSFGSTFKKVDSATSVAERATLRCARASCDLLAGCDSGCSWNLSSSSLVTSPRGMSHGWGIPQPLLSNTS